MEKLLARLREKTIVLHKYGHTALQFTYEVSVKITVSFPGHQSYEQIFVEVKN